MTSRRRELAFQKHIIDSYTSRGGMGKKWASEWQVGPPDLVLSMPSIGTHLMEVKHRPTFGKLWINNPMTEKQMEVAEDYVNAGSIVLLGVVSGEKATVSTLHVFYALLDKVHPKLALSVPYVPRLKYDVTSLVQGIADNWDVWTSTYGTERKQVNARK